MSFLNDYIREARASPLDVAIPHRGSILGLSFPSSPLGNLIYGRVQTSPLHVDKAPTHMFTLIFFLISRLEISLIS